MSFPSANILAFKSKVEFTDWWTVDSPGFTHTHTLNVSSGVVFYIDWGDGEVERLVGTGNDFNYEHVYGVGVFNQKISIDSLALTGIILSSENLTGGFPELVKSCINLNAFSVNSNNLTQVLDSAWMSAFGTMPLFRFWVEINPGISGDIALHSVFNTNTNLRFYQIRGCGFYGDVTGLDFSACPLVTVFMNANAGLTGNIVPLLLSLNQTTIQTINTSNVSGGGDVSTLTFNGSPNLSTIAFNKNDLYGTIANLDVGNLPALSTLQLHSNNVTGLNTLSNNIFINRSIYTRSTKLILLQNNSELLTGVYQQPDLGTYTGNINDLTETQITALSIGTDYDGLGSNVPWSTLEKVWILENLETSSSVSTLRYGFSFTYDSASAVIQVPNSGALGMAPINDRLIGLPSAGGYLQSDWTPNTSGLADDWETTGAGIAATSIVTGNGFDGNAQRCEASGGLVTLRNAVSFLADGGVPRMFTYRASADFVCRSIVDGNFSGAFTIGANTGDAVDYFTAKYSVGGNTTNLEFDIPSGEWIEIDGVEVRNFNTPSANGADDWLNPVNGLADGWLLSSAGSYTASIVTGNGFIGNAQRLVVVTAGNLVYQSVVASSSATYVLVLKMRANIGNTARINLSDGAGSTTDVLFIETNTSDAAVYTSSEVSFTTGEIVIRVSADTVGDWIEIDEVELLEV